ncbi:MAG: 16S rRNA (guanine(527)-N(7))-methyltransferase RsmG, partial [Alphaproteobacteria bacterium]
TGTSDILDLGSGGGFPGLVLAIMLAPRGTRIEMVESDTRKATFLRTVVRETGIDATITAERVEAVDPRAPHIITARAFAPLPELLAYAAPHMAQNTLCLFPKGQSWKDELTAAEKEWTIDVETIPSLTAATGVVLKIRKFDRV